MSADCCLHQVIQSELGFQIFEVDFSSSCNKCLSEPFFWLIIIGSRKNCLALQYIAVVVCSTAFFHKSRFVLKKCLLKFLPH